MNDTDFNLPEPERCEDECFNCLDYFSEEYADAKTLEEAIDIRGAKAFLAHVTPDDFSDNGPQDIEKVGIAELWYSSIWREGEIERDVAREHSASSLKEGDRLEVRPCPEEISEWGYRFHLADGVATPYEPYHDYDDQLLLRTLESLTYEEQPTCHVRSVSCFGENGIDSDPAFCWRVYSCKVTVCRSRPRSV